MIGSTRSAGAAGSRLAALLLAAATTAAAAPALAWEAQTTHAGLAEEAALASALHKRLVELGFTGGLFELLTIPPADAPQLLEALRQLSPTHGAVPDARGRMTALSWIAAGASIADAPVQHAANHFFDPTTGAGWVAPEASHLASLWRVIRPRTPLPARGVPAPDWVVDAKNPLGVEAFWGQYHKAITAATPGERSRHMAAALVAAGAVLHVLGDVGTPSHARGDAAAHLEPLARDGSDLGSRFDRVAALAFGRLGVPGPSRVVTRTSVRGFFTNPEGTGLADVIGSRYFSAGTLPADTAVGAGDAAPKLARARPGVPARLNLMAAARDEGTTLKSDSGVCLARYRVERNTLEFFFDDACLLEQAQMILPEVAAYEAGLLDFLLRGQLALRQESGAVVVVAPVKLGAGQLDLLVEDSRGQRTSLKSQAIAGAEAGAELIRVGAPAGLRIVAVYRGKDERDESVIATASATLE
jgi:hypothetical protein